MTWLLQSPDLNPIEMILDELDVRVKAKHLTSAQHLFMIKGVGKPGGFIYS